MAGKIPGIHLYCDGWCERCPYTQHCAVYEQQEEVFATPASRDMQRPEFWQNYRNFLGQAALLMVMAAKYKDLDLEEVFEEIEAPPNPEEHPLVCAASAYANDLPDIWTLLLESLPEKAQHWQRDGLRQNPESNPLAEASVVKDAVAQLKRFPHFLVAKLTRAVTAFDDRETPEAQVNGQMKAVLTVIGESLEAWGVLWSFFEDHQDIIMDKIKQLTELKTLCQHTFPHAQSFIRPGFDSDFGPDIGKESLETPH